VPEPVTYPTITRDDILDGMVAALASITADEDNPVSAERPLYTVDRYMGELGSVEAFKRGVAGRTPAVRVAFVSDRSVRTTIGRRVDLVEATFVAAVFSDTVKSKDDRKRLLGVCAQVQGLLGARRLGLEIKGLRHRGTTEFPALEHCTAYGVQFVTRYRVSYVKDPGDNKLLSTEGSIFIPPTETEPGRVIGQLGAEFEENP
jgi:hypothetical protein